MGNHLVLINEEYMTKKSPIKNTGTTAKRSSVKRNSSVKGKSSPKTSAAKKKTNQKERSVFKKIGRFLLKAALICLLLSILFFTIVYLGVTGPVPTKGQLQNITNPVASEVFSEDGIILGRYYIQNRSNVTFDEISPNVVNALIATEDARFYEHKGIDELALLRVLVKSILLQNRNAGGGSTLSQQIAKNLYPRKNFSIFTMPVNKLREAIIAYRLEKIYSKDEILTFYLNTVPFAENTFGIETASERFFSKKPSQLKVNEAAAIVGMLKANTTYNPRTHPERALERRNVVIEQMVKYSYLTKAEGDFYKAEPLRVKYKVITYNQGPAPYFIEKLRPQLVKWCEENSKADGTPYNLYTDGLKIQTTINYDLQRYANIAVDEHMKQLQRVFDTHWKGRTPWGSNIGTLTRAISRSERYKSLAAKGVSKEQIDAEFKLKNTMSVFTWDGIQQKEMSPLDSIKHYLKLLNTGLLSLDPFSGEVKAYVGGIDFRYFKYDHTVSKRQVGSTFKPIVYLAALEDGIAPDTYFPNEQKVYGAYDDWSPRNSHDSYGGFYSMEGALSESLNTIAVDVLMQTGIRDVINVARDLGISSDLPKYPSLALGVASISLEEMVCAYAAFANSGRRIMPYYLVSISDENGNVLESFTNGQDTEPVMDSENCKLITHMLKSVVRTGTGSIISSIYGIDSDFAGKTGTTQNQSDGWFVGMSPNLVTGVWVGAEDPSIHFRTITYGQGGYMALPIVGKYYHKLYRDAKFKDWKSLMFDPPSEELLAKIDIPQYKEALNIEKKWFDLGKIFGKNNKDEKPKVPKQQEPKTEKKVWEKIKDIFKKKDKK